MKVRSNLTAPGAAPLNPAPIRTEATMRATFRGDLFTGEGKLETLREVFGMMVERDATAWAQITETN